MSEFEVNRIRSAYKKRGETIPADRYSLFDSANLFLTQRREAEVLRVLKKYSATALSNSRILDVGCGTGAELRNMMRYGARPENLYGIDLLAERIATAQELSPNMHLLCGNAETLPYEDCRFDLVLQFTAFTSILESEMKQAIAREMIRVLKNDGMILWYDYHMDNPKNHDVRGIKKREILCLFDGCNVELKRVVLAPPIVRMLAPYSRLACYFLEKLPFLRTHYLGVVKKRRV